MGKIYLKNGIGIAGLMIAYFLILKLVGLHKYPIFSAANGLIIGAGIYYTLINYKRKVKEFKYEVGFQLGIITGSIASFLFVLFMAIYVFYIDKEFTLLILDAWNLNFDNGAQILLFTLLVMSFSTVVILTLTFMQLLKESMTKNP